MKNCVNNGSSRGRHFSQRTWKILQYLASHPHENHGKIIAEFLKERYNTVFKTLQRLTKKGLVKNPHKGFWMLNHGFFRPSIPPRELCQFVCLHGVGLVFDVPKLWERLDEGLIENGTLVKSGPCYRGRSLVFGGDLRLYSNSAYFQWKGPPLSLADLMLLYEDALKTLDYFTRGLAEVKGAWLNDYELGFDEPFDMLLLKYMKMKKITTYLKNDCIRKHIQFNKKGLPLPLNQDTIITMHADLCTSMTEEERLIEQTFRTLLNPKPRHD